MPAWPSLAQISRRESPLGFLGNVSGVAPPRTRAQGPRVRTPLLAACEPRGVRATCRGRQKLVASAVSVSCPRLSPTVRGSESLSFVCPPTTQATVSGHV